MSLLHPDTHNPSLSNPPPSPVTDCNRESSPDFESTKIMNKLAHSPEEKIIPTAASSSSGSGLKPAPLAVDVNPYEDDFLDMTCDDMDLF